MTMCDNTETLVSYLYGELDAADRRRFEQHLSSCAACRDEVAGLRSTRELLTTWAPPEPDFGLRLVRGAVAPPPSRWFRPAWGLAAAAVLVLAAASAIANVEVRYGQDGLVVRTGWTRDRPAAVAASAAPVAAPAVVTPISATDLAALEQRLRVLESASSARVPDVQNANLAAAPRLSDEALRRVRDLVRESQLQQQQDMTVRLTALAREVDRRLVLMQQGLEGNSRAAVARDTQIANNLRLIALQK